MVDATRQRQFDALQKLLARALDRASPREQKIAIRKLYRLLLAGTWQPHELMLVWADNRSEFANVARLAREIERLETKLREKEVRILEIAGDYQQLRDASKQSARGSKRCPAPLPPPVAQGVWSTRIAEMENQLYRMEKQFGFTDAMRIAINLWYRNLTNNTDRFAGRTAVRNWLRQHNGYERARVILDEGRLRWRRNG